MPQENISKIEWIQRCAKRFMAKANVEEKAALQMAYACFDCEEKPYGNKEPSKAIIDFDAGPEEAADIDISYWEE